MASNTVRLYNFNSLPKDRKAAVSWAQQNGLLRTSKQCSNHKVAMVVKPNDGAAGRFRCPCSSSCQSMVLTKDTFFEETRLPIHKAIGLMYAFSRDWSYEDARHELCDVDLPLDVQTELGQNTIHAWYNYFREMVVDHYSEWQQNSSLLGRPGVIVQIDESKFGRRKYNRGRRVEGQWVVGMIEKTGREDLRMFVVKNRDAGTLIPLIKDYVATGTEIHTDSWKGYLGLENEGFIHKQCNHIDPDHRFVAPDGTHTQRIESTWGPAKTWFRNRHCAKGDFGVALCGYLFRRHCRKNGIDVFGSLIDAVKAEYVID